MKFADGSEIVVSVRCEATADAPSQASSSSGERSGLLTLVVQDGGRGMSAEECSHIFDAYFRAPTHKGGGTGLGALRAARCAFASALMSCM